jgi:hypothetical protein
MNERSGGVLVAERCALWFFGLCKSSQAGLREMILNAEIAE